MMDYNHFTSITFLRFLTVTYHWPLVSREILELQYPSVSIV